MTSQSSLTGGAAAQKPTPIIVLLTANEAAKIFKVSLSWLAKARMRGDGPPYIRVGRSIRYAEAALIQWMKSRQRLSTSRAVVVTRSAEREDVPEATNRLAEVIDREAGIIVHLYTSVYINRNEVELRLGTEYRSICGLYTIDVFLNYIIIYLQPSRCLLRLEGAVPMTEKHTASGAQLRRRDHGDYRRDRPVRANPPPLALVIDGDREGV